MRRIKNLFKESEERHFGDLIHNKCCEKLIEATSHLSKQYQDVVLRHFEKACKEHIWIQDVFGKTEVGKLAAMLKSKSFETLIKRYNAFVNYEKRTPFLAFLNREKIIATYNAMILVCEGMKFNEVRNYVMSHGIMMTIEEYQKSCL